jgi:hypothetical protein
VLLTLVQWEAALWWVMLTTAGMAATLSIGATILDRRKPYWPTHEQRFRMHVASYCFLTISILAFVMRGLLMP